MENMKIKHFLMFFLLLGVIVATIGAVSFPVDVPLVETPPIETPPIDTPPVEMPPVETPPVEALPVG